MFVNNLNPVFIDFGVVQIRYYGILLALAYLTGYFGFMSIIKNHISREKAENVAFYSILSAIIFQRLVHVFFYDFSYYMSNPIEILEFWKGGIASHGAILGFLIGIYYFSKKYKKSFYLFSDPLAIYAPLVGILIRIGNFINGEIVGRITNVPWAVKFRNYVGYRHPVQLYEAFGQLIIFFILFYIYKNRKKLNKKYKEIFNIGNGLYTGIFFLLYGIIRFILEYFKEYMVFNSGLTMGQYLSTPLFLFGGWIIWKKLFSR